MQMKNIYEGTDRLVEQSDKSEFVKMIYCDFLIRNINRDLREAVVQNDN